MSFSFHEDQAALSADSRIGQDESVGGRFQEAQNAELFAPVYTFRT